MRNRTIAGIALLVGGLAMGGGAAAMFFGTLERNAVSEHAVAVAEASCREQIGRIGAAADGADDRLSVILRETEDPRQAMADLTAVVAACPTREIVSSCIGTTCGAKDQPGPMRAVAVLARKKL